MILMTISTTFMRKSEKVRTLTKKGQRTKQRTPRSQKNHRAEKTVR